MNFTLRQLQAFLTVAELCSFTRAAERLRIAQPALSLLIKDLETSLGVRLLDRTTRRTELTEAGREFRSSIAKIIDDLEHVAQNMNDLGSRARGRITIAAPPLLAATMLPDIVAEFQKHHSGITVSVIDTRTDLIVQKVRSGEADCGIGTFPPDEDGVSLLHIAKDHLMAFCHRESDLVRRRQVTWKELDGQPIVALTRASGIRLLAELAFESTGHTLRPAFEVSAITTALGFVKANLGVAVLPAYAYTLAQQQNITVKPLVQPTMSRQVSLISPQGRSKSPAAEAFSRVLQRMARVSVLNPAR